MVKETLEETLDDLRLNVAFNSVASLIKKKSDLSNNSKFYINQVKDYFKGAIESIDSMLDETNYNTYSTTRHLVDIMKYFNKEDKSYSSDKVEEIKNKFIYIQDSLDKLEENPKEFHESPDSSIMSHYFNNFSSFFNEKYFENFNTPFQF